MYLLVIPSYCNIYPSVAIVVLISDNFFVSIDAQVLLIPSNDKYIGVSVEPPDGTTSVNAFVPLPTRTAFTVLLVFPVPPRGTVTGAINETTCAVISIPGPAVYVPGPNHVNTSGSVPILKYPLGSVPEFDNIQRLSAWGPDVTTTTEPGDTSDVGLPSKSVLRTNSGNTELPSPI